MAVNLQGIRRNIKNVAHNYTDAQIKVREATSNDPWGPSSTCMSEIADLTYKVNDFSEIMHMVWKRLNDHGKNWRHVYKALVLLEYLIKTGSEKVAQQCKENIFAIQTLKDFQYLDDNKDQGINVREKAKALVALLKDDDRLKNERVRALKAKERFAQSPAGIGSDTVYNGVRERFEAQNRRELAGSGSPTNFDTASASELEAARPQTAGEEELQLQLALAMSREEHEQEESKVKSDDMRLQLALQQSKETSGASAKKEEKESRPSNDLLDLADINFGNPQAPSQPPPPQRTAASSGLDPWGTAQAQKSDIDPWGAPQQAPANNDPWATIQAPPAVVPQNPRTSPAAATFGAGDSNLSTYNDPWNPVKGGNASQQPAAGLAAASTSPLNPTASDNDPWMTQPSASSGQPATIDPFSPVAQNQLAEFDLLRDQMEQASSQQPVTAAPSNNEGTTSPNPFDLGDLQSGLESMASTGAKPKTKPGGVQSILGEHSNLVNLDDLVTSSKQPVRNPFEQQPPNPFQAAKAPKPAMNELLHQKTTSGWQQQPSNQQDMNPFF